MRLLRRYGLLVPLLAAAMYLSSTSEIRQDYRAYTRLWARVAAGGDPWVDDGGRFIGNAYGPLHNLLALPYQLHPALPRLLFAVTYVGIFVWFLHRFGTTHTRSRVLAAAFFANMLFWVSVVDYGHNDIMCATFALAAVALCEREKTGSAGVMLAFGVLSKLYPLALLPFLALDGRAVRWRLLTSFLGTMLVGFGLTWWFWGGSFLVPFLHAAERESSLLSIFYFLRGSRSPLVCLSASPNVDWLSGYLTVASLGVLLLFHVRSRLRPASSAALAVVVLFTFSKVGHFQFYITAFLLLAYWYYGEAWAEGRRMPCLPGLAAYLLWFTLMPLAFRELDHFKREWAEIRQWVALPSFVLQVWLIGTLLGWRMRKAREALSSSEGGVG